MNKKEVLKYLKENELNIQSANAAIIALDLVYVGYIDSDKIHGVKYSPIFSYLCFKNLKPFFQIIPQKIITEVSRNIYLDYCKDKKNLDNRIKKHKELEKKIDKLWKKFQKNKKSLSDKEILEVYKRFIKTSREWWKYGSIGEDKGEAVSQEIVPRFAKRHGLSIEKAKNIVIDLSFPKEQSVFNAERKAFLNICLNPTKEKIKLYIKNYFWFDTNFYKKNEMTPEGVLKKARAELKKRGRRAISDEIIKINEALKDILEEKKKIIKDLNFNNKDKDDIYFAEQNILWFDQRKEGMMKNFYYLFSFLEDLTKKYKLKYHKFADLTVEELESFLESGKYITKKEEQRRKRGVFLLYEKNKKIKIFYEEDAQKMLNTAISFSEKELKGPIANNAGLKKIKGKVSIILDPNKEHFKEGEILVTSMTRIEFIPLMRKAKAIITNEGGIACHAAIVSRELGIPSIIGTKNATKVLKTGDTIELNLKTGVIKIIKN